MAAQSGPFFVEAGKFAADHSCVVDVQPQIRCGFHRVLSGRLILFSTEAGAAVSSFTSPNASLPAHRNWVLTPTGQGRGADLNFNVRLKVSCAVADLLVHF